MYPEVVCVFAAGVNFLAVLVAALASMVLGYVWYSAPLFGKAWFSEMGFDKRRMDKSKKEEWKSYIIHVAVLIVMAFSIAGMLMALQFRDAFAGALVGVFLWTGFIATTKIGEIAFGGQSVKLFFIDGGYSLVCMALMGAILAVM